MLNLLNSLLQDARRYPDSRLLWHDLGAAPAISLGQLRQETAALKERLALFPSDRWLLYTQDPHRFLLGFLVLLGMQKKIILSASNKPDWLASLHTEFDAILTDEPIASASSLDAIDKVNFPLPSSPPSSLQVWQPHYSGDEEIVFYTSGSTGHPKAVLKTLRALTNETTTLRNTFANVTHGALFVSSVSHLHIYGLLFRLLLPLLAGGSSISQQIDYHEQLLALPGKCRSLGLPVEGLVFVSSPTFLSRLDPQLPAVPMQAVFSSGGPLPFPAAQDARGSFAQLPIEVYGSTETGGIGYRQQDAATTAWTVFAGITMHQVDDGVALLSPNMPGRLPYLLDDLVDFLPGGNFVLKGRKDRIIKLAEKRVSLTEIEKFLETHDTIRQCVALPLTRKREMIGCVIVLSGKGNDLLKLSGPSGLKKLWRASMQDRFDAVVLPRQWRIMKEIPVNSQNKIDSSQLLGAFAPARKSV